MCLVVLLPNHSLTRNKTRSALLDRRPASLVLRFGHLIALALILRHRVTPDLGQFGGMSSWKKWGGKLRACPTACPGNGSNTHPGDPSHPRRAQPHKPQDSSEFYPHKSGQASCSEKAAPAFS